MIKITSKLLPSIGVLLGSAVLCSGQTIFSTDFGTAPDGPISGAAGWEGQAAWTISGGNAINGANFSRARNLASFGIGVGDTVSVLLTDVVFTGAGNGGNDLYAFGVAALPEHTGAQTPQVRAELQFTGTSLSVGSATDTAYAAGSDVLDIQMDFVRLANGSWDLTPTITNKTDATSFVGSTIVATNLVGNTGAAAGLTLSEYLDADPGNTARFGMRGLTSNTTDAAIAIGGISVDLVVVPEPSTYALITGLIVIGFGVIRRRKA
ncbi:MAG: PEP-CTERM sorting domain-containing protein [Verrucomicrobiota bacterium]